MHLWQREEWKKNNAFFGENRKTGIHFIFDKGCDPEVKLAVMKFARWLRHEFEFPSRLNVYLKQSKTIKALDGERVSATFWGPFDYVEYSYIKVAVGDYHDLLRKSNNRDDALAAILFSISHEVSHYYQWLNSLELSQIGEERQATIYSKAIVYEYALFTEHP